VELVTEPEPGVPADMMLLVLVPILALIVGAIAWLAGASWGPPTTVFSGLVSAGALVGVGSSYGF
jgi:hypothetical protein